MINIRERLRRSKDFIKKYNLEVENGVVSVYAVCKFCGFERTPEVVDYYFHYFDARKSCMKYQSIMDPHFERSYYDVVKVHFYIWDVM